uniref:Uncharacterized protein n=1 Tax=Glossina austeni TaxID=7395 RepID=A0A1A9UY25_GLOAU
MHKSVKSPFTKPAPYRMPILSDLNRYYSFKKRLARVDVIVFGGAIVSRYTLNNTRQLSTNMNVNIITRLYANLPYGLLLFGRYIVPYVSFTRHDSIAFTSNKGREKSHSLVQSSLKQCSMPSSLKLEHITFTRIIEILTNAQNELSLHRVSHLQNPIVKVVLRNYDIRIADNLSILVVEQFYRRELSKHDLIKTEQLDKNIEFQLSVKV